MSATYELGGLDLGTIGPLLGAMDQGRDNTPNTRIRITFPNGLGLSLVWGWGAYCDAETVEVGVFGLDGEFITKEIAKAAFGTGIGDEVDGWCDAERVHGYFLAAQGWKA